MSGEEVKAKAKETVKSVAELLKAVKNVAHDQLSKNAPKVVNTLDSSFDKGSRVLTDTLRTIDRETSQEQLELLNAYRSFLQKQTELIERKMTSIKQESPKKQNEQK